MTSPATHEETVRFLEEKERFGLAPRRSDRLLPGDDAGRRCPHAQAAVGRSQFALVESRRPRRAAGGAGRLGQVWPTARRRGIRYLFYVQIDNPLVSIGDPEFLGYHIERQSEVSTQVVAKRTLRDKVGNVVTIDGKLQILEYSDLNPLPDEIVGRRAADGSPVFWAGNIAVHIFDLAFLEQVADSADGLPFHFAHKAVPSSIARAAGRSSPKEPNALKFERFIFDLLPAAKRAIVYEVDAETAFAPVKNAPGEASDTPETVQRQMISLATQWLAEAGATGRSRRCRWKSVRCWLRMRRNWPSGFRPDCM